MAIESAASLIEALRQCRLLTNDQLDEVTRLAPQFSDPRDLARQLMERGWLTPFQVNQLFLGRGQDLVLGQYVLLERIGEGGMGQVFKARHRGLDRIEALKVIRKEHLAKPEAVLRFRQEIRLAAQLSHPNVVLAFDADETAGVHYFAMEYIEGTDLGRILNQSGPLPIAQVRDYLKQIALGLQHAHELGLVHRDIKPANLLLSFVPGPASLASDEGRGTKDQGPVVKILDMGLARVLATSESDQQRLTQERRLVGTADYMAPEQARDAHSADIRSDLYSLGCTAYHLLTGQVPYPAGLMVEKLVAHQLEEPTPLEQVRPDVPPALAGLVRKLMAKRPEDRFQTPDELVQALDTLDSNPSAADFTAAVPVATAISLPRAVPVAAADRPWRFPGLRRHWPLLSLASGAALLVLVVMVVLSMSRRPQQPPSKSRAKAPADDAVAAGWKALLARAENKKVSRDDVRYSVFDFRSRYPGTPQARQAGDLLLGLPSVLDRLKPVQVPASEQFTPWQPQDLVGVLGDYRHRHWGAVNGVAISPDGELVASGGDDGLVRLWNSARVTERTAPLAHQAPVRALAVSPDGKLLAAGVADKTVWLWELAADPQPRLRTVLTGHSGAVNAVVFAPNSRGLATGGADGSVRLWELTGTAAKERAMLAGDGTEVLSLAVSSDGRLLAAGAADGSIRVWNLSGSKAVEREVLREHTLAVPALAFAPDSRLLASGDIGGQLHRWDLSATPAKQMEVGPVNVGPIHSLTFAPFGRMLAIGTGSGWVRLLEVGAGEPKRTGWIHAQRGAVYALAFGSKGRTIVAGGQDGTVRLWDGFGLKSDERTSVQGPAGAALALAFAPDGQTLAAGYQDATTRIWDLRSPPREATVPISGAKSSVRALAFSPTGKSLALAGALDRSFLLYDVTGSTPRQQASFPGLTGSVAALAVAPDGKTLAVAGEDAHVHLWDLDNFRSRERAILKGHTGEVAAIAFSPDGKRLASAGEDQVVRLWDLDRIDPKEKAKHTGHTAPINAIAFSPDGTRLASASEDGTVQMWDPAGKRSPTVLTDHRQGAIALAFCPDGKKLASTSGGGQVILWDAVRGAELRQWQFPGCVYSVAFAWDGRFLATANANGTIYVLRLGPAPR